MLQNPILAESAAALYLLVQLTFMARAILRPHRQPASRIAWVVVIAIFPVVGIVAYILFGETSIGRRRLHRVRKVLAQLDKVAIASGTELPWCKPAIPELYEPLFRVGHSVNGFAPVGGNHAQLLADSNAAIDAIVADIDTARDHVHICFYIWLPDNNGLKVVAALQRAAARKIRCRVLADALGSRTLIESDHWRAMQDAGVHVATALPLGNPLLGPRRVRIDLRNHRKIVVIDNHITYCGSQNCADPEFRIKAKYAPWVDLMVRFTGPMARQNQFLFAGDWMAAVEEDLTSLLAEPLLAGVPGLSAQVIGTGPTVRYSAMPEVFESLLYAARHEVCITTPYYVPDESMQAALCASARRGVNTVLIVPARNDSWVVAATSRSYYFELLSAGVHIYEYEGGLLHSKSLTMDGAITLIGSANMDRRSFDLNFENNILLHDRTLTAAIRARQDSYISRSQPVTIAQVTEWSTPRRLLNNTVAMFGPVL